MLTGKHSFINGKIDNVHAFNWDQDNFCKELQKAGYQTAMIGKIHMDGLPQGFDYSAVLIDQGEYYNPDFIINGVKQQKMGYVTDLTTAMTLDWIKTATAVNRSVSYTTKKRRTANGCPHSNTLKNIPGKPIKNLQRCLMIMLGEELPLKVQR